jgi:hypothetical protein
VKGDRRKTPGALQHCGCRETADEVVIRKRKRAACAEQLWKSKQIQQFEEERVAHLVFVRNPHPSRPDRLLLPVVLPFLQSSLLTRCGSGR